MMRAYSDAYLGDVVENQGKLFDYIAQSFPDKDTEEFINVYMSSKTRKSIDESDGCAGVMAIFFGYGKLFLKVRQGAWRIYVKLDWGILCILSMVL